MDVLNSLQLPILLYSQSISILETVLNKVLFIKETKGYVIYTTPFGFIAQKGDRTAHGKTVKKAISDLEFKFVAEKLKKEPIKKDTVITTQYYKLITGACEQGIIDWKRQNSIDAEEITAEKLLPMLQKSGAYGLSKFKKLIQF